MACRPCGVAKIGFGNFLLALDRLVNALLLGNANETISQRAARAQITGNRIAAALCGFLDLFDSGHCTDSLDPDSGTNAAEIWDWNKPGER
jgi:hypothetical protein